MIQPNAHDVFLSYAREDGERARVLADRLGEHGWSVWWDRDLPPGESFADVTAEALEAARCVVVLWSQASVASPWVQEEAARGQVRQALFPIRMDDVEAPEGFRGVQAATLAEWDGSPSHPQLRAVLSQLGSFLESSGSAAQTGSMGQEANAPPATVKETQGTASSGPPPSSAPAPPEASQDGPPATSSEAPREAADEGPATSSTEAPREAAAGSPPGPTPGLPTRIARAVPGAVFLLALAAWGVSAVLENLRSVTVRLSFAPAVHWAVTPPGTDAGEAAARAESLIGFDRSGLWDLARRGPHRLDAFFLVVENAESGDTLAVVESFREDVLLLGADTAAAVSSLERADSAGASLLALLDGGGLSGGPASYVRQTADSSQLTWRSVEVSRALTAGTPIRLSLMRVDWGGGEPVAQVTVRAESDCREATGGGGFLGRGRVYDCFVFAGGDAAGADQGNRSDDPVAVADVARVLNQQGAQLCREMAPVLAGFPFTLDAPDASLADVAAAFQPGTGALWTFYDRDLVDLLESSQNRYVARPGAAVTLDNAFVDFFNRAADISRTLYSNQASTPRMDVSFRPRLSDRVTEVTLMVDGESSRFTPVANRPFVLRWDGSPSKIEVRARVDGVEQPILGPYEGSWALLRWLDAADQREQGSGSSYVVRWSIAPPATAKDGDGGVQAEPALMFEADVVAPSSFANVGALSAFRCIDQVAR